MSDFIPATGNNGVGAANLISNLISQIQSDARNWATFGINTYYANQDREFQREAFEYQKQMNEKMMQREDTAIQRRAADLAAAGINPLLAGLGGAQANIGGIINPTVNSSINAIPQQNMLGEAMSIAAQTEKQTKTEKEINKENNNAQNAIHVMDDFFRLAEARINANSAKEVKELENEMKWKIETHKAIKELIGATGIPALDVILKDFVDGFTGNESLDLLKEKINEFKTRLKKIKEENLIDENANTLHLDDVGNGIIEKIENGIKNLPEKLKEDWIKALNSKPARKIAELWGKWIHAKNEEKEKIMEQVRK